MAVAVLRAPVRFCFVPHAASVQTAEMCFGEYPRELMIQEGWDSLA